MNDVPLVEWWDEVVLGGSYDMIPDENIDSDSKYVKTITNLVEHPIQLKPPDEPLQPQYLKASFYYILLAKYCYYSTFLLVLLFVFKNCFFILFKVYLTSRERKKIRRQNRKEAQKEQTEKIRLFMKYLYQEFLTFPSCFTSHFIIHLAFLKSS